VRAALAPALVRSSTWVGEDLAMSICSNNCTLNLVAMTDIVEPVSS
jgi:hypothetical protein